MLVMLSIHLWAVSLFASVTLCVCVCACVGIICVFACVRVYMQINIQFLWMNTFDERTQRRRTHNGHKILQMQNWITEPNGSNMRKWKSDKIKTIIFCLPHPSPSANSNSWEVLRRFSVSVLVNCNVNSNFRMGKTKLAFQIIHWISFGIGQVPKLHSTDCCFLFNLCQIICQNCRKKKKKLSANILVIEDTFVKCFPSVPN